jgi:hypothetical protein
MTDTLLDIPPPPDQRITQIFVWLLIDTKDGSEGIISHDLPMAMGTRHAPLMASKRATAMKMQPIAERVASATSTERGRPIETVLRTFWS